MTNWSRDVRDHADTKSQELISVFVRDSSLIAVGRKAGARDATKTKQSATHEQATAATDDKANSEEGAEEEEEEEEAHIRKSQLRNKSA